MGIAYKEFRDRIRNELATRYAALDKVIEGRDLKNAQEGIRGSWKDPDKLCYIDALDLRLAVKDFSSILSEVGKIK